MCVHVDACVSMRDGVCACAYVCIHVCMHDCKYVRICIRAEIIVIVLYSWSIHYRDSRPLTM